eukprot:TRINITY_DN23360_c0_g1_i1.p1 TRINITY_DN23360_c0_g1~~TRINITY_DN23360_c0_g1_i1.p1  ORF type:complete len:495 (-),score=56.30 TRINITY_DN23360_c0_g1_i1:209-1693(-)
MLLKSSSAPCRGDSAGIKGLDRDSSSRSELVEDQRKLTRRSHTFPAPDKRTALTSKRVAVSIQGAVRKAKLRCLTSMILLQKQATQVTITSDPEELLPANRPNSLRSNADVLKILLLDPINILLLAAPLGLLGASHQWSQGFVFLLCFTGLVPLAKLLGDATEHLAENLNGTVGGLLNATFGNAVELIITVSAIRSGLLDIVKQSCLGSILSNLLLVLGMSFFAGGVFQSEQRFPDGAALINMTMLCVGSMAFSLPTVFSFTAPPGTILKMSRVSSIFVGIGYIAYLIFQLYTHIEVFDEQADTVSDEQEESGGQKAKGNDEEEEEHLIVLSIPWALGLLLSCTLAVAVLSEMMVGSIEGLVKDWGVPPGFVGVILLPIVGNACEHASAVRMAMHDKCGTAIGIAVGSSTQMTLLAMPFAVITAWIVGQPLDFDLTPTGITVLTMSVLVVLTIVMDGRSNWLEGFMLMLAYCLVAVLYWYVPESQEHAHGHHRP